MDIKKTFIKVFNSKDTIFGRSDSAGSSKVIGGLANYNRKFVDLVAMAAAELNIANVGGSVISGVTEVPDFNASTYPEGTVVQGDSIGAFISDGIQWVTLQSSQKKVIEIPNTEFAIVSNPTISEVRTWVDANLTDLQKVNSELYMIEALQDFSTEDVYTGVTFFTPGLSGVADINITSMDIDGVNYPISSSYKTGGVYDQDVVQLLIDINTATASAGLVFDTITVGGPHQTGDNFIMPLNLVSGNSESINISINFDNIATLGPETIDYELVYTITTLGSTPDEPDYIWSIVQDEILQKFRRQNDGAIWYIDPSIAVGREVYGQKGNPDRPLRVFDHIQANANLVDNDTVLFRAGNYTTTNATAIVKGNVYYKFEPGAIVGGSAVGTKIITAPDGEFLNITGYLDTQMYVESDGVGEVSVTAKALGNLIITNGTVSKVHMDVDHIEGQNTSSSFLSFYTPNDIGAVVANIKTLRSNFLTDSFPNNCDYNVNIGRILFDGYNGPQLFPIYQVDGLNANINIGSVIVNGDSLPSNALIGKAIGGSGHYLTNSTVNITVDYFKAITAPSSEFNTSSLVNLNSLLTFTNSNITLDIKSGVTAYQLYKGGANDTVTDAWTNSNITYKGNLELLGLFDPLQQFMVMDSTSYIALEGKFTTPAANLLRLSRITSAGTIFIRDAKLQSEKEAIEVTSPDSIIITNSTIITDGTVDIINTTNDVVSDSVVTNTLVTGGYSVVGTAPVRNAAFRI